MFDHKFSEHLADIYNCLDVEIIDIKDNSTIDISPNDDLIDLSPCIGIYQEASYFSSYNIKEEIEFRLKSKDKWWNEKYKDFVARRDTVNELILFLTAMETNQMRYIEQAIVDFVNENEKELIHNRISTQLNRDEIVQVWCKLTYTNDLNEYMMYISGLADVVKDDIVYELKFVNELSQNNFLQTAMYMFALNLDKGILWNVKNNIAYNIKIKDKNDFANKVAIAISKGNFKIDNNNINYDASWVKKDYEKDEYVDDMDEDHNIAVIDVETNCWSEVVSIGVAIADKNSFMLVDQNYWLIGEREQSPSMYSNVYHIPELKKYGIKDYVVNTYDEAIEKLIEFLDYYNILDWFSYAKFDYNHLPELHNLYNWFDISIPARNVNTNDFIPKDSLTFKNGALKSNWKVESMYRMLSGNSRYSESHNALLDAIDELKIMQMLELTYEGFVTNTRIKRVNKNDESAVRETNVFVESNYSPTINTPETNCHLNNSINESNTVYNLHEIAKKPREVDANLYTNQDLNNKNSMITDNTKRSNYKNKLTLQEQLSTKKVIKKSLKNKRRKNSKVILTVYLVTVAVYLLVGLIIAFILR
ncbi:hypothetical protein [Mycoplasmopsis agalactiae]|uniref:hypothetical protein n=1 Tax=Mycoplasmopsis agalactiae TaxID=2110 RepID=UPI0027DFD1A9|nr:hypothetical protein [Mycoplasmopsis agalactiae]